MNRAVQLVSLLVLAAPSSARGGSGENALLVIDPTNAEAMYVANVYREKRDLPFPNALYMEPGAASYTTFVAEQGAAFLNALDVRGIEDHVDYVIISPTDAFYVPAPGLIDDACFDVSRMALASAYTLARRGPELLTGASVSSPNGFGGSDYLAQPFDSSQPYADGAPNGSFLGRRYFIGAQLGWTGQNGNTLQEVLDLIDRSVAADDTHPLGTAYFMETSDVTRSSPRDPFYPSAVNQILGDGGSAQHLFADLPLGNHDCLGIMTGLALPDIDGANLTLLPGAFADHLTSFAGTFDNNSQTKMSRWIAKGACATSGTVEEPCNYAGKFPHARLHVLSYRGMTIGESWLRSMAWEPFQNLLLGDPLTQPFAHDVSVSLSGVPGGSASGTLALTPTGSSSAPGALLATFELLVDGVVAGAVIPGGLFQLDTTLLADGHHELRVLAIDDDEAANAGTWKGGLDVDNAGLSVTLAANPLTGNLAQRFDLTLNASGGTLEQIVIRQAGRVVASSTGSGTVSVYGQNVGAGPVRLVAEARFASGAALSLPVDLDIVYDPGTPALLPPQSYAHRVDVPANCAPFLVELPGAYASDPSGAAHVIVQEPAQATRLTAGSAPYAIFQPDENAFGTDSFTFRIDTPGGSSSLATVELVYSAEYCGPPPPVAESVSPASIASVVPGKEQSVTVHGSGFFDVVDVTVAGAPVEFTIATDSEVTLVMPNMGTLGPALIELGGLYGMTTIPIEVVPADPPALELGDGDDPETLVFFLPLELLAGGTPGEIAVIFASLDPAPSLLPGVWDLAIGGNNANLVLLNAGFLDSAGQYLLSFLPQLPPMTTVYFQSANYDPVTPVLPLPASNVATGLFLL